MHIALARAALVAAFFLPAVAAPARAADAPPAPPANPVAAIVTELELGPGIASEQVILFPLFVRKAPEAPELVAGTGSVLTWAEPEKPARKDGVTVFNARDKAVLVTGGTVLEGGKRDRMVLRDHVLAPGATVELPAVPASTTAGVRRVPSPFRVASALAPTYLRAVALKTSSTSFVSRFVSHFLEFRGADDARPSLVAVAESPTLAEYCLSCQRSMDAWPKAGVDGVVVGGVTVVRGRVQSFEVFGSNGLVRDYFEPVLQSLAFPAAAIELRAKKAGIPIPGKDDPEKTMAAATAAATALLAAVKKSTYESEKAGAGDTTEAFAVRTPDGEKGRAVTVGGRLAHLVVFPDDPFEYGLYSKPLEPLPPGDDEDREGVAELVRRGDIGRLSEYERRLLERLGGGPATGPGVGGGTLPPRR